MTYANVRMLTDDEIAALLHVDDRDLIQPMRVLRNLAHFYRERGMTPLDSWRDLGVYRLSASICELRRAGYKISAERIEVANRYGEPCHVCSYFLLDA